MFVIGEFFRSLIYLVEGIYTILYFLLIARIVVTWLPVDPYSNIVQFLVQATDPILLPFRRIPLRLGMLDFTAIIAFVALYFIKMILIIFLSGIAAHFLGAQA